MAILSAAEQVAQAAINPLAHVISEAAAPPPTHPAIQSSQAGAEQSWDAFREYWGATAPAQTGFLAMMRDRLRGIG